MKKILLVLITCLAFSCQVTREATQLQPETEYSHQGKDLYYKGTKIATIEEIEYDFFGTDLKKNLTVRLVDNKYRPHLEDMKVYVKERHGRWY